MLAKHWSLNPRTNVILATAWLIVCTGISLRFPSLRLLAALAIGIVGGVAFGLLQSRAIRANPAAFRDADSVFAVRRAAVAVGPGAKAIRLQWLLGVALFILGLSSPPTGFFAALAGYFAMMFVRELVSYRSLAWLQSDAPTARTS